jgi:hypothetical protein
MNRYVEWGELAEKKKYLKWIAEVTNPRKPGKFYQLKDLNSGDILINHYRHQVFKSKSPKC